jgi:hypothetical protein
MTRLGDRLRRDLESIANQAQASDDGWRQIQRRLEIEDEPHTRLDKLEPSELETTRGPLGDLRSWAVAAAIILFAGSGVLALSELRQPLGDSSDESQIEADASQEPVEIVESYVEAFNAGDGPAAVSVFANEATIRDGAEGSVVEMQMSVTEWEEFLVWHTHQRSTLHNISCSLVGHERESVVQCEWLLQDALARALDRSGVLVKSKWRISSGDVTEVSFQYIDPADPLNYFDFADWLHANYANVEPSLPSPLEAHTLYASLYYTYNARTDVRNLGPDILMQYGEVLYIYAPTWGEHVAAGPTELTDHCDDAEWSNQEGERGPSPICAGATGELPPPAGERE